MTLPDLDRVIHSSPSPVILLEGRREIPPEFALHELGHVLRACHRPLRRNAFRVAFGQASPRDYHEIHRREAWKTASTLRLSWWPGPHRPAGQPSHYGMTAGGEERFCELIALMHAHGGFAQQPPNNRRTTSTTCGGPAGMTAWRGWSEPGVHQVTTMPLSHRVHRRIITRHIVTLPRLTQANWQVTTEMSRLGFWTTDLDEVGVYLVPASLNCYGWHDGHISIPCVSGAQLYDLWHGYHTRLTDVLRHEWAHAVAHTFPDFIGTDRFVRCFGGDHEYPGAVACYDPAHHVTAYAAAMPCEDFAEVFHHYLRHKGRLPVRLAAKKPIVKKWAFIDRMAQRIAAGKFRF